MRKLQEALDEANSWIASRFGDDVQLWQECTAGIRYTVQLGRPILAPYDMIPLLFARLGQPGVRARCQDQWASVAVDKHDRVSIAWMGEGSALAADIAAVHDDGSNMSDLLKSQVPRCVLN
jgi:hypothetical protein